jgi:predicted Zn-dependent protease
VSSAIIEGLPCLARRTRFDHVVRQFGPLLFRWTVFNPHESCRRQPPVSKITLDQAAALTEAGRPHEALAITGPLAAAPSADARTYALHAAALKAAGRREEALTFDQRAIERFPQSRIAWHNLGATLGDLGQSRAAAEAIERAFGLGLDASETWLVYARALAACGAHDEAEAAYAKVVQRMDG